MPTYDYKCPKCGTSFQLVQKITAKGGAKCPKCGTKAERQLSGGAGIVFKGSGFYLTDYGRSGQKAKSSEGGESSASSSSDKAADKSSEKASAEKSGGDKPAAKPAAKPKKKDD